MENSQPSLPNITTLPHLPVALVQQSGDVTEEKSIYLDELNQGWLVLYFYPKDATPGCTIQANEFSQLYPVFKEKGIELIGISRDNAKSHEKFICKQAIPFPLIADDSQTLCEFYDVIKPKNMYGKMVTGIVRSTFIYKDGQLVQSYSKVKPEGHAQAILDFIQQS